MTIPSSLKIILIIVLFFISVFIFFVFYLRVSIRDISSKDIYTKYLKKPVIVQTTSELMWVKGGVSWLKNEYVLYPHQKTLENSEFTKSIKIYNPGDTIYFNEVKLCRNPTVGNSHYLIGKDTLPNGKEITFEYNTDLGSDYNDVTGVEIWETITDYYKRFEEDSYLGSYYSQPYRIKYSLIGSFFQVYSQGELIALETNTVINPKEKTIEITQKNIVGYDRPVPLYLKELIQCDQIYFKLKNIKLISKKWYEVDDNLYFKIKLSYQSSSDLKAFDFNLDKNGYLKTNLPDITNHNALSISENNYWYYFKKDAPIEFNIKKEDYENQFNALPYWKDMIELH